MQSGKPVVGQRLASMILDHFIMCVATVAPLATVLAATGALEDGEPGAGFQMAFLFVLLVYMGKDSIGGRSPAKRILKLRVIDNKTLQPASPGRCFVRNLFVCLWPVEVLVVLFSPGRRIGDFVGGTRVVTEAYMKHLQHTELVASLGFAEETVH
jgi:uncharacterized RDD family membrane protein YckC